jgi:hypothetical protein
MALIEVSEREKRRETKVKGLRVDLDVMETIKSYRTFLVTEQQASEGIWTEERIINEVLRGAFKGDKDFQKWNSRMTRRVDELTAAVGRATS